MRATTIVLLAGMLGVAVVGSGCFAAADNDTVQIRLPTLGQELSDLQKAKQAGAVTDNEYEQLHKKLLECDRYERAARCARENK